jgi:transcriptional regulator with XRE-family HTH domain
MAGPHGVWDDREPSEAKRARVRRRKTLAELAGDVGYSVTQIHRLETGGRGSADLRRRVAQVLGIGIPPARGYGFEAQLLLFGASSS